MEVCGREHAGGLPGLRGSVRVLRAVLQHMHVPPARLCRCLHERAARGTPPWRAAAGPAQGEGWGRTRCVGC
jgi:hypothetical protein